MADTINETIVINLDQGEYSRRVGKVNELFQKDAFKDVASFLDRKKQRLDNIKDVKDLNKVRTHDAIYIRGARGSGKTMFLLNIEKYRELEYGNVVFHFLDPIDPTLLENREDFLSIILGRLTQSIEVEYSKGAINEDGWRNYLGALEEVVESLEAVQKIKKDGTAHEASGLERIIANRNGLELEQKVHTLFKKAVSFLQNKKGIVVLIDDVDMAFDKGFEVLEVVRKYLATPYAQPIITGHYNQYEKLLLKQFRPNLMMNKQYYHEHDNNITEEIWKNTIELSNEMVQEYLTKVFPNHKRTAIKDVKNIFRDLGSENIVVKNDDGSWKKNWNEINKSINKWSNYGILNKDLRFDVINYKARRLIQQLNSLRSWLYKNCKNLDRNNEDKIIIYINLIGELLRQYKDYDYQRSGIKELMTLDISNYNNIDNGDYSFILEYAEEELKKVQYSEIKSEERLFKVEEFRRKLFIPKQANDNLASYRQELIDEKGKDWTGEDYVALMELFAVERSLSKATASKYIIGGKFLKVMLISLNLNKPSSEEEFKSCLTKIWSETDFVFADERQTNEVGDDTATKLNPTRKTLEKAVEGICNNVASKVRAEKWDVHLVKLRENDNKNFLTSNFIRLVINKFIEDINKQKDLYFSGSTISAIMQRYAWTFINALAFCEQENARNGIPVGGNYEVGNYFERNSFKINSSNEYEIWRNNTYQRNLKKILNNEVVDTYTKLFSIHPLIRFILEVIPDDYYDTEMNEPLMGGAEDGGAELLSLEMLPWSDKEIEKNGEVREEVENIIKKINKRTKPKTLAGYLNKIDKQQPRKSEIRELLKRSQRKFNHKEKNIPKFREFIEKYIDLLN